MSARTNLQDRRRRARRLRRYDKEKFANQVEARLNVDLLVDDLDAMATAASKTADAFQTVGRSLYGMTLNLQKPRWGAQLN